MFIAPFLPLAVASDTTQAVLDQQKQFFAQIRHLTSDMSSPLERWLAFGCAILLTVVAAFIIRFIVRKILKKLAQRTVSQFDDQLIDALQVPFLIGLISTGIYIGTALLHLQANHTAFCHRLYLGIMIALVVWLLLKFVRVISTGLRLIAEKTSNTYNTLLIALLTPVMQMIILTAGVLLVLDNVFGFNIAALLAGAGIVAMAVAFAAQNTIADIFGAVALISDRPFQLGSFITVGDKTGVVESIGLRSTRLRSLDGTQWSIPNRTMTDTAILNISMRPSFKHIFKIGLTYDTTPEQLRRAQQILHDILDNYPRFDCEKQPPLIYFDQMADYSIDFQAICWFQTTDWAEFMKAKEEINYRIYEAITGAGLSFAFPSQSLYIEKLPEK